MRRLPVWITRSLYGRYLGGCSCRRRIRDATPSGVSRVRVTQTSLLECDIGLHRTVTVDSHRRRTDTPYKCPVLASLEWTCFLLPLNW